MAGGSGSVRMAVLLVAITVMLHSAQEVSGNRGKELVEKIMNKCVHYTSKTDPLKDPNHASVDCEDFLKKFKSAFVGKDPKTITPEAYNDLKEKFKLPEHKDKYLFWSGTGDLVKWLKENKNYYFYQIDDTVFGSLNVGITKWCGKEGSTEIFTEGCPDWKEFPDNPYSSYWRAASRAFAQAAMGDITVLLNDEKFYNSNSIFATDELPNLNSNSDKVSALRVIIVGDNKDPGKCKDKSLDNLTNTAGALKDKYHCRQAMKSDLKTKDPKDWWNTATP